jgi:hypothetical protein
MKFTSRLGPAVKRSFLRLVWHSIPFVVLTLVVVPVLYAGIDQIKTALGSGYARVRRFFLEPGTSEMTG